MLIYNHKKEFIGIDEEDLNTLGFSSFEDLRTEASDFADMFVKTPGHVHNFQHVNWIDFVACADSTESTKVIIHANSREFRCLLNTKTVYLTDDASKKAYLIYLNNIRELTNKDNGHDISEDIVVSPIPAPARTFETPIQEEIIPEIEEQMEPMEQVDTFDAPLDLDSPVELDFHNDEEQKESLEQALEINLEDDNDFNEPEIPQEIESPIPQSQEEVQTTSEVFDNGYVFDPHVASNELGLPVDLIEEFIEDFIAQAKEFKDELYTSYNDGDVDNIKVLSHKLKGVAANLRIEDALESLTIINTSENTTGIKEELDLFYKIISKLSGEKTLVTKAVSSDNQDLDLNLDLVTESTNEIEDFNPNDEETMDIFSVPQEKEEIEEDLDIKIEIPELADDNFLEPETNNTTESIQEVEVPDFLKEVSEDDSSESIEISEVNELEEPVLDRNTDLKKDLDLDVFSTSTETLEPLEEISIEEPVVNVPTSTYDTKSVADEIGLSQENFMELFQDYIAEAQDLSTAISDAATENNPRSWQSKAAQLKGMSENMRVTNFIQELETLIQTENVDTVKETISIIETSITELSKIEE